MAPIYEKVLFDVYTDDELYALRDLLSKCDLCLEDLARLAVVRSTFVMKRDLKCDVENKK